VRARGYGQNDTQASRYDWSDFNFHLEPLDGEACDEGEELNEQACAALRVSLSTAWNGASEHVSVDSWDDRAWSRVQGCVFKMSRRKWSMGYGNATTNRWKTLNLRSRFAKVCSGGAARQTSFFDLAPSGEPCKHPLKLTANECLIAGVQATINAGRRVHSFNSFGQADSSDAPQVCSVLISGDGWQVRYTQGVDPSATTSAKTTHQRVCADAAVFTLGHTALAQTALNERSERDRSPTCGTLAQSFCEERECRSCAARRRHSNLPAPYNQCAWYSDSFCCSSPYCASQR